MVTACAGKGDEDKIRNVGAEGYLSGVHRTVHARGDVIRRTCQRRTYRVTAWTHGEHQRHKQT
jgi:hypothetical protein